MVVVKKSESQRGFPIDSYVGTVIVLERDTQALSELLSGAKRDICLDCTLN